jgi:hypothetical protein
MISMIMAAMKNLVTAITKGCAAISAILVAVDAEAHKKANAIPVNNIFLCIKQ